MTAAIEPRAELPALTGLRGIAAWFVVLFHVRTGLQQQASPALMEMLGKGYLAVDLFFMLSGFVLWLNYGDRLRAQGPRAAPAFLARRIARIGPLHIAMLTAAVAFAAALRIDGRGPDVHYPWSELPLHILLMQNWGLTTAISWNDPAWSISCEFAAYLLFPWLVLAYDWRRLPTGSILAGLAALAFGLHLVMAASGWTTLGNDIPRLGLPRALTEFAMGMLLAILWQRFRGRPFVPLAVSLAIAVAAATAAPTGLLPESLAVPTAFAALLLFVGLTGSSPANPLCWRPIRYLGEISYSTYLVHFLLYIAFKLVFVEDPTNVPLPLLGLFLAMVLAMSIALHHGLERPAQRALNRFFDSRKVLRRAAAGA